MTVAELVRQLVGLGDDRQDFEVYLEVPEVNTFEPAELDVDEEEKAVFIVFED